jgi:hypothetical protein
LQRVFDVAQGGQVRGVGHRQHSDVRGLRGAVIVRPAEWMRYRADALVERVRSRGALGRQARADDHLESGPRPAHGQAGAFRAGAAEHGDGLVEKVTHDSPAI